MKIREISLRELMKCIMLHWKKICIVMLISAMVMTGFVFYDNWFINNAVMEEYHTALNGDEKEQRAYYAEKLRERLEEAEAKEVETLVSYENSKKIYEKTSHFYEDPDNIYIKSLADVKILNDYISLMIQYNKYIPKTKGFLTEEQGYYYEYLTDGTMMHWDLLEPEKEPIDRWLDIAAIALLAGFVYIFVLVLRYISDGNLRNYDNINELFGVPQLGGMIVCDAAQADNGNLEKTIFDIAFMASRANTENVVLTGSVIDQRVEAVMKELKHALNEKAVHCDIAEDIINDITALQHFANADGVVLVETVGKSNCKGIAGEMELAAKYDTKVLGVVKL